MATKGILRAGFFILSLFYLTSCDNLFDQRIEGNNIVVTKERLVTDFDEVVSTGNFDVYVSIADSTTLIIEAEENLFPFINTNVSGQKFYVEVKDDYNLNNNKPMKIMITTANIEGVRLTGSGFIICDSLSTEFFSAEITGSGKIYFDNIDVNDVEAEISGSGDIILTGTSDRSEFDITGSGNIRTLELLQENCNARITGSGNIYVNVVKFLKAEITGSGNIYYIGDPTIDKEITGTGKVLRY